MVSPLLLSHGWSKDDEVIRLDRGIYQLADADLEVHHSFAEVAKRVPNGVVCLVSALEYHEMTDQLLPWTWIAIGYKDWKPISGNSTNTRHTVC